MKTSTQFRRTDRAIIDAMIRLLRTKSYEQITVQNILDETPVTRATFYAHFRDKDAVAERMQDMHAQAMQEVPTRLAAVARKQHPHIIQELTTQSRDLVQALLKIHTDRVDLRALTVQNLRQEYLAHANSPYAETEAEIYAQAMTALSLSYLSTSEAAKQDADFYDKVMVAVFLRILNLDSDEKLRRQIQSRLPAAGNPF